MSKRAIEAEMGIKMPEWEWKASKKGKGKGKGKGKKSSLQEPSTSKPPTSTDLTTTQGTINTYFQIYFYDYLHLGSLVYTAFFSLNKFSQNMSDLWS